MPKHKWDNAHEWLDQYLASLTPLELLHEAYNLTRQLDGDQIQDLYQSDMDRQGYFAPIEPDDDFPVVALEDDDEAEDRVTCGTCGRSWDDAIATSYTPAPAARCPFEYFH